MPIDSKCTEASLSSNSTDLLGVNLAQVPKSPDLAILSMMMTSVETK